LVGIVCTVDRLKRDAEVKLLLGCTPEEVDTILSFHNDSGMMSAIAVWRDEAER
jgi:inorganic pyrophosphatase